MSVVRKDWIIDRFSLANGGHNSGDDPELIEVNQYADSQNITNRGGRVRSRPRFVKKADLPTDPSNELYFQGITHFKSKDQIVLRANGRLYRLDKSSTPSISDPPYVFTEIKKANVTVWEAPVAQVDTLTITSGSSGTITLTVQAVVNGVAQAESTAAVSWNSDAATTAADLETDINGDADMLTLITPDDSAADGTMTLTSVQEGRTFLATIEMTGDIVASIATTTENYHFYYPNEEIAQGRTVDRPTNQTDRIYITEGTLDAGVNTINVTVDGNSLATAVDHTGDNVTTAAALVAAINADGTINAIVTASTYGGQYVYLVSDTAGAGFTSSVTNAGDVESTLKTIVENPTTLPGSGTYFYDWDIPHLMTWDGASWSEFADVDEPLEIDIPLDANPLREQVWFEEVGELLVIQDGQKQPITFDGSNWDHAPDVPVGTVMRFANGRLHLVSAGQRRTVQVGDILQNGDPQTALKFTETGYLLGGGSFAFPEEVTALHEIPIVDTASGQGSMVIGTTRNTYSLRTEITDRDLWSSVEGFMRPILPGIGIAGPNSIGVVNNDLYFRSTNGLRSLRMAVGEQQSPGYGGLHQEIPEKFYNWGLSHNSTVHAGDRLITLVNPKIQDSRFVYEGGVVINFESLNRLGQKSPISFDGYWTLEDDHYFRQIVEANNRVYAVVQTPTGDELWELQADGFEIEEESTLEQLFATRAMQANDPMGLKTLGRMDIWLSDIQDDISMDFEYRVDGETEWRTWHTLVVTRTEGTGYNPDPPKDFISRYTLPTPPDNKVAGYHFQFRVKWTGRCKVDFLQAYLKPLAESQFAEQLTPITLT